MKLIHFWLTSLNVTWITKLKNLHTHTHWWAVIYILGGEVGLLKWLILDEMGPKIVPLLQKGLIIFMGLPHLLHKKLQFLFIFSLFLSFSDDSLWGFRVSPLFFYFVFCLLLNQLLFQFKITTRFLNLNWK